MNTAPTTTASSHDIDALNGILRGESAAFETYDLAVRLFGTLPISSEIHRIRDAHQKMVDALRDRIVASGGSPSPGSGPWETFAAVGGAEDPAGPATLLTALKQGEVHGIHECEATLADPAVDPSCKDMIRTDLLPKCRVHLADLDHLLAGGS